MKYEELLASTVAFISYRHNVYRCESGRCHSLSFFLTFFYHDEGFCETETFHVLFFLNVPRTFLRISSLFACKNQRILPLSYSTLSLML